MRERSEWASSGSEGMNALHERWRRTMQQAVRGLMVSPFTYQLATSIKFGSGHASKIGEELRLICNEKKIAIISDPGVLNIGITDTLMASLKRDGFTISLFSELDGEASAKSIDAAADLIRTARPSAVIGLGGGNALDVAKFSAALASVKQGAEHYALAANPLPRRNAKLLLVPTTAGTGAEVTRTAVFTNAEHRKVWAWGEELASDLVILDPKLTRSLPGPLTAATALDAMVHAIEACTHKSSNPIVRSFGLHAIRLVAQNLEQAIDKPRDVDARGKLLVAATLAGMAIDGAGAGIAHSIGHALGSVASIHHGRAVALALDAVFSENANAAVEIHADIALALGIRHSGEPQEVLAKKGAQAYRDFIKRSGIQASLKPDGLSEDFLGRLVEVTLSEENKPMCDNNCYRANEADIRRFFQRLLSR
jgi:alcohol dehydrogenase class IV